MSLGSCSVWLNQIELYFSIVQRKALTPNEFASRGELAHRLLRFGDHYRQIAQPFDWTFTRTDLDAVLAKIDPLSLRPPVAVRAEVQP